MTSLLLHVHALALLLCASSVGVAGQASPHHTRTRSATPSLTTRLSPSRAPLPLSAVSALLAGGGRPRAAGYAQGTASLFSAPAAVALLGGVLYVADSGNNAVRALNASAAAGAAPAATFAGGGAGGSAGGCVVGWGTNARFTLAGAASPGLAAGPGMGAGGNGLLFLSDAGCATVRVLCYLRRE
jgi:hypothetical protein